MPFPYIFWPDAPLRPPLLFHRHALRQVSRFIHIGTARKGGVIRQHLQRYDVQDRREGAIVFGHADDVQARFALNVCVAIGEDIELTAAGTDFLHVGLEFFQQLVIRRNRDDGHLVGHKRERAMLEFTRGISLGVDV